METRKLFRAVHSVWRNLLSPAGVKRVIVAKRSGSPVVVLQVAKGQNPSAFVSAAESTLAAFSAAHYADAVIPLTVEVFQRTDEQVRCAFVKRS